MKKHAEKNNDINVLYICERDIVLTKGINSIIIKDIGKNDFFDQIWLVFWLLVIMFMILAVSVGIMVMIRAILDLTAWSILFLLIFVPGLFLACKMFMCFQALLFGFNLSLSKYFIKGRWGIIPIRRTIKSDAEIILSLGYRHGDWGCGGKIKSCRKDIFPCSLFVPYVLSSKKSVALRELDIISNWLAGNLSTVKIVVKKGN